MDRFFTALLLITSAALAQNGQIVVTTVTDTGAAVPNALVRVGARPFKGSMPNYHAVKTAGVDGKATFSAAPQGAYEVCAQLPGTTLLDSCEWLNRTMKTYLQANATNNLTIVMKKGSRISVVINDTKGLLARESYLGQKLTLTVSIKDSHKIPMTVTKATAGRQFTALVPADSDLRLQIRSSDFQLTNSAGTPLDIKTLANFIPIHSNPSPLGLQIADQAVAPTLALEIVGLQ